MPNKNDLSAYKVASKPILNTEPNTQNTPKNWAIETRKAPAGRKPLPAKEKRSEVLVIKLTPAEMNAIDSKRGLADRAVYVRHVLGSQTNLLEPNT